MFGVEENALAFKYGEKETFPISVTSLFVSKINGGCTVISNKNLKPNQQNNTQAKNCFLNCG